METPLALFRTPAIGVTKVGNLHLCVAICVCVSVRVLSGKNGQKYDALESRQGHVFEPSRGLQSESPQLHEIYFERLLPTNHSYVQGQDYTIR